MVSFFFDSVDMSSSIQFQPLCLYNLGWTKSYVSLSTPWLDLQVATPPKLQFNNLWPLVGKVYLFVHFPSTLTIVCAFLTLNVLKCACLLWCMCNLCESYTDSENEYGALYKLGHSEKAKLILKILSFLRFRNIL